MVALAGCTSDENVAGIKQPQLTAYLQANAAPLRSTEPNDTSFDDLEPLGQAIGSSRVVLLGEETHGDGTTFLAKTRLIKYLHERLGFDVIAFESGLFDTKKAWEKLRDGENELTAVRRGVFSIWTSSAEVQPLIDYLGAQARGAHPLELSGFDSQFTGTASRSFFRSDLTDFVAAQGIDVSTIPDWAAFLATADTLTGPTYFQRPPTVERQQTFFRTLAALRTRVDSSPNTNDIAFWRQMLRSLTAQAVITFDYAINSSFPTSQSNSARDVQMGENLIWLARSRFPTRKIIVWSATFHIIRNASTINTQIPNFSYAGLITMGHKTSLALGSEMYAVGFVASGGTFGVVGDVLHTLGAPGAGSLEAAWAGTTHNAAFLDLRSRRAGDELVQAPFVAGPLGYAPMFANWSQVLDGFVYTRTMTPSTLSPR